MKYVLILIFLISCGKVTEKTKYKNKEVLITEKQILEGIYYLQNGGQIELVSNSLNRVSISTTNQFVVVKNASGDYGSFPSFTLLPTDLATDNILRFSVNLAFISGNNVYSSGNVLIIGTKRVDFSLEEKDNEMTLTYQIYSGIVGGNIGTLLTEGTLEGIE